MTDTFFFIPTFLYIPIVLTGYTFACLFAGLLVLYWMTGGKFFEQVSAGTTLATAFILGEGVLGGIWLLFALKGWLSFRLVAVVILLLIIGGLYIGRRLFITFHAQLLSIWRELREDTWGWQFFAGIVTFTSCILWGTSLGRAMAGDGPAFYFALAKFIASSHLLTPMPGFEGFTNVGLLGELHYAALMILHSPSAAKLFSWPTILAGGIMLASLGRTTGMGRRGQWLTLGILFSSSAVILLNGDGKVDLFGAVLGLAAYYWAVQVRFDRTKITLFLVGLFSGFSIVAKLSYAPVMVPSIAFLVLWGYSNEWKERAQWVYFLRSFIEGSLIILAGLVIAFIPHFIKNGLLYDNPLSPFGSGGMGWLNQTWYGPEVTRHILLTYPLALTYGDYWAQYGNLSPLILAFLPLALFLPRPRSLWESPLSMITIAAMVAVGAWILYSPSILSPRYIMSSLLLLALLPARAAEYVSIHDQRPRLLSLGVLVGSVFVFLSVQFYYLDLVFFPSGSVEYALGHVDECERDSRYTLHCRPMEMLNKVAEPGTRIYWASFQHYWLRGDLLQCISHQGEMLSANTPSEQLWLQLYENGFTYLFFDKSSHEAELTRLDVNNLPGWVQLKPIYNQDYLLVYHIKFENPPSDVSPSVCVRQPSSTIWEVVSP
jgi:hypothetical protein